MSGSRILQIHNAAQLLTMSAKSSTATQAQSAVGHAFISYAREDEKFANDLHAALRDRKHDAWIDRAGIPLSAEWGEEIRKAIDSADACLFIIAPDFVSSKVCRQELEHAVTRRKRLVPILRREVTDGTIPTELAKLNWVFLREEDAFDAGVDGLVKALDTDLEWVRDHTWLTLRAVDWEKAERDSSSALRGRDLARFENWLQRAPDKEPAPTALQSEFIIESRRATARRQRIVWSSLLLGAGLF